MTRPITNWTDVTPVPVSHIADYYDRQWESHKCLAWQLLRRGYRQLSVGRIEECNNLFEVQRSTAPADTASAMHAAEMRGQDMQDSDQDLIARLASHNDNATPGKWGQYHPCFMDEAKDAPMKDWDTSHNMSAVKGGKRWRVADWKHADDAAFAEILVNAYRSGQLITEAECQRRIDAAVAAEREACAAVAAKHAETGRKKLAASETREEACNWALIVTRSDLIEDAIRARGQK